MISLSILIAGCQDIGADRPTIFNGESSTGSNVLDETPETEVTAPIRPSNAVVVQPGHCGCRAGQPITVGECANICTERQPSSEQNETLYLSLELTADITLDVYQNFLGWCTREIEDAEGNLIPGASCAMEIKDERGNVEFADINNYNEGNITLNIGGLDDDVTYRLTIIERTSEARSTTFQLRKYTTTPGSSISGPLQYMPVNRYSCGIRNGGGTAQNQESFERFHLYFNSQNRPEPLQQSTIGSYFCHDLGPNGNAAPTNSPLFEESTGVFTLWDKDDPRFFDLDGTGIEDINEIIEREVKLQGASLTSTPQIFTTLEWLSAFDDGDTAPGDNSTSVEVQIVNKNLGYFMSPFLDDTTFRSYCPTQEHYFSDSPFFKAMREVIAIDTEALYIAKQDNVCDFILVNQSVLREIWFYRENGIVKRPTDENIRGKQIQFYWPATPESWHIKKSHQRVYTIKSTDELTNACDSVTSSTSSTNSNEVRTNIPPHDKRLGCIPVLGSGN